MTGKENRKKFLDIVAEYGKIDAEDITMDLRFREDMQFSSLDFMAFLGELEDEFDLEVDQEEAVKLTNVGEALAYMNSLCEA